MESARYEDSDEEDMEYEEVLDLGYVDEVGSSSSGTKNVHFRLYPSYVNDNNNIRLFLKEVWS